MDEEIHHHDLKALAAGFPTSFIKMGMVSSAQGKVLPMQKSMHLLEEFERHTIWFSSM